MEGKKRKTRAVDEETFAKTKKTSKIVLDSIMNEYKQNKNREIKSKSNSKSKSKSNSKSPKSINQIKVTTDKVLKNIDTAQGNWNRIDDSILTNNYDSIPSSKILGFDLDDTLIRPKSGAKFANNKNDWTFIYDKNLIKEKIMKFVNDGYRIVIFTNQNGIKKGKTNENDWKWKVDIIQKTLDIPMLVIAAIDSDYNRKPSIGMWKLLEDKLSDDVELDPKNSIYVGDAAGRNKNSSGKKDHSDSDLKFALNVGMDFQVPEEFFRDEKILLNKQFQFDPKTLKNNENIDLISEISLSDRQEMIILVGSPASGKSSLVKNYMIDKGYVHVNNDTLKTQIKCQKVAEEAMKEGKSVVIDNTNPSKASRKLYLTIAQKYKVPVRCLLFKFPKDLTFHLNNLRDINISRKHHSKSVPDVVIHSWYKNYEEPTVAEGFKQVKEIQFVPGPFDNDLDEEIFYLYS